jgi:predicted SPOUT superfamily RNA methylase MTH1
MSPTKKRKSDPQTDWTVTIALTESWTLNAKKPDHKTIQIGRIVRAAAVFCVDEIVLFDDDSSNIDTNVVDPKYIRKRRGQKSKQEVLDSILEADELWQNPDQFLFHLLSFAECPPHLRYDAEDPRLSIFKQHQNLKWVVNLLSMDMPRHLRSHEWCQYREGVGVGPAPPPSSSTPKSKKAKKPAPDDQEYAYVNCGLPYPDRDPIPKEMPIEEGMCTTVRFANENQQQTGPTKTAIAWTPTPVQLPSHAKKQDTTRVTPSVAPLFSAPSS